MSGLPDDVVGELIALLESRVQQADKRSTTRCAGAGSHDVGQAPAVQNVTYPASARWEPIFGLLEEPTVAARDKRGACDVLASSADRLDAEVRTRLAEIASAMAKHPVSLPDRVEGRPGALGPASELAASLSNDIEAVPELLASLLAGNSDQRSWATQLALRLLPAVAAGVLAPLTQDPEPSVRRSAASDLAQLAAASTGDALALAALRRCAEDPGTRVPRSIANALTSRPEPTAVASDILRKLASHRSASVRTTVADYLRRSSDGK